MTSDDKLNFVPEIRISPERKLIGMKITTNFLENRTVDLWRGFMPRRKEVSHALNQELLSVQVFKWPPKATAFDPSLAFDRWAGVEVSTTDNIPEGMQSITIPEGLYAVFNHVGATLTAENVFKYFYGEWLPSSDYLLDDRPHFEILDHRYKNNDPNSEEEIWIPIVKSS